jgi:Ni/Fe-hydrogenase 1 B-type cytochrome subunit
MTTVPKTIPVPRPVGAAGTPAAGPAETRVVAARAEALAPGRLRLYVWELPVRLSHWIMVGAIVVLSFTGGYIADPFLIPPGGQVMGTVRLVHMIAAFALILSGILRIFALVAGNRFARWSAFFPITRSQLREIFSQAAFYAFLSRHHPKVLGHNQLAASAYVVLWALLLVETITGFALDGLVGAEPGSTAFWWLRELIGPQTLRLIHHAAMWAILAIALFHIYSCVLIDHIERNGLISSIFSGFKYVSREEIAEARDGGSDVTDLKVVAEDEGSHGDSGAGPGETGPATADDEVTP